MKDISEKQTFVGCDVSKETLDFALYVRGMRRCEFPVLHTGNNAKGLAEMARWLRKNGVDPKNAVVGMEHTGSCSDFAAEWLHSKGVTFVMLSPLAVKRWGPGSRAKTDVDDARVIADYLYTHREKLQPSSPVPAPIRRLRELRRARNLVVKSMCAAQHALGSFFSPEAKSVLEAALEAYKQQVKEIDKKLAKAVRADSDIAHNYALLTSIRGVGPVNAINAIVATRNFTTITDPRKYAKFAAVAPLECRSGTSVHKGAHVSPFGHRDLKSDLTCAAKSAIQHDPEISLYYQRQAAKGKPHGKIMNAIKFKLICRMFAVIKRRTPYVPLARFACAPSTTGKSESMRKKNFCGSMPQKFLGTTV